MSPVGSAVGVGSCQDAMSDLDREMGLGNVETCEDVDVGVGRGLLGFYLQHDTPPGKEEKGESAWGRT